MGKELNRLGRIKNRIKSTEKSIKAQNEETKVRITTCKKEVNNTFDALMKNIEKKTKDFEKQLNHNKDDVGSKIDLIESIKKVEAQSNVSALSETFDNIKKHLDESIVSEGDLDALVQKHAVLSAEVCRAFCEKLVTALKILSEEKHSASGKAKPGEFEQRQTYFLSLSYSLVDPGFNDPEIKHFQRKCHINNSGHKSHSPPALVMDL